MSEKDDTVVISKALFARTLAVLQAAHNDCQSMRQVFSNMTYQLTQMMVIIQQHKGDMAVVPLQPE
jgi:hypothetical protein